VLLGLGGKNWSVARAETRDRATVEVLVARNAKVAVKTKALSEARDVVEV